MPEYKNNEKSDLKEVKLTPGLANIKIKNKDAKIRKRKKVINLVLISIVLIALILMAIISVTNRVVDRKLIEADKDYNTKFGSSVNDFYSRDEWRYAFEKALPFMVGISKTEDGFKQNDFTQVTSGIIIDKDGYIAVPMGLLNETDKKIVINIPADMKEVFYNGELVGVDKPSSVLIYKSPGINKSDIKFLDENAIKMSDTILLVATPFGSKEFGNIKNGIVHTKSMLFTQEDDKGGYNKVKSIIGSFPIDISNDGGAVINLKGELIGMANNALTQKLGLNNSFAIIPFSELKTIVNRAVNKDETTNFLLGIKGNYVNLANNKVGFYVLEVNPNTTASRGGILPTDLIIEIDGKKVNPKADINTYIQHKKVGEVFSVKVERKGKIITLVIKIY